MESFLGRHVQSRLVLRLAFHRLLTTGTPMGRKMRAAHRVAPLIRTRTRDLIAAKVGRTARMVGVRGGRPLLADGRVLDVANVIWSRAFSRTSHGSIFRCSAKTASRYMYARGAWRTRSLFRGPAFSLCHVSTMLHGVGRDARHVANAIARAFNR